MHLLFCSLVSVLVLFALKPAQCQLPVIIGGPALGEEYQVVKSMHQRVNLGQVSTLTLRCIATGGGTFRAWVKKDPGSDVGVYKGTDSVLEIELKDSSQLGAYYCTFSPPIKQNTYRAMLFLVSEKPGDDKVKNMYVKVGRETSLRCEAQGNENAFKWERYNDLTYKYDEIPDQTKQDITFSYADLLRDHDSGFTYYRCSNRQGMRFSSMGFTEIWKLDKESDNFNMRSTPVDIASVPIFIDLKSSVKFECHKVTSTDEALWYFRSNSTSGPADYKELSEKDVEISNNPEASILGLNDCSVQNKGYYRCIIGGVVKYAFLDFKAVVPTIHEYSKQIFDLNINKGLHELECEVPKGGEVKHVVWRIIKPDGSKFDIPINSEREGFKVVAQTSFATSNQMATITFQYNPKLNNYRLECRIGDEADYVTVRSSQPPITIEMKSYAGDQNVLTCKYTTEIDYKTVMFYVAKTKDFVNAKNISNFKPTVSKTETYFKTTLAQNYWFRCSGKDSSGTLVWSSPIVLYKDPLLVEIRLDGEIVPNGKKPMVEGQPANIDCKFTNLGTHVLTPNNVKLIRDGVELPDTPTEIDSANFRFSKPTPSAADSGKYKCQHSSVNHRERDVSVELELNWCRTDQFMCDFKCWNNAIKCDGKPDCQDGTDENPSLCAAAPCEPNELACKTWNFKQPARSCALKHWFCDGADDCENNYDEESPEAKKFCIDNCNSKSRPNCGYNSSICAEETKCIPRSYECDSEVDCASGTDEKQCSTLIIQSPSQRTVRQEFKGSTVILDCTVRGMERPTINWRCNWGHLRAPERMTEENMCVSRHADGLYTVRGTLTISNFQESDECLYNCEAITKRKREISPDIELKTRL